MIICILYIHKYFTIHFIYKSPKAHGNFPSHAIIRDVRYYFGEVIHNRITIRMPPARVMVSRETPYAWHPT